MDGFGQRSHHLPLVSDGVVPGDKMKRYLSWNIRKSTIQSAFFRENIALFDSDCSYEGLKVLQTLWQTPKPTNSTHTVSPGKMTIKVGLNKKT